MEKKSIQEIPQPQYSYRTVEDKIFFIDPPSDVKIHYRPKERWSSWRKANFAFYEEYLKNVPSGKLLDIGAGQTEFKDLLLKYDYIGLDFYPHEHVQIITDITKQLPVKDGSVDIIILSNVLEHTPEPELLVKECLRTLKAGGLLLGTVPFLGVVHKGPYDFYRYTNYMLERFLSNFSSYKVMPLGKMFDVNKTFTTVFFNNIYRIQPSLGRKLLFKVIWKIIRLLNSLAFSISPFSSTNEYTEGYGFRAVK